MSWLDPDSDYAYDHTNRPLSDFRREDHMTHQEQWDEITLKLATDRAALLKVLTAIAYEPIGASDASHEDVLRDITDMARAAIAQAGQPPRVAR